MAEYDSDKKDLTMVPEPEKAEADGRSPYLKFQDKNGNGIPDHCDDVIEPAKVCKNCIPNPYAIVSNWRDMISGIPRINEKNCTYEVCLVTNNDESELAAKMQQNKKRSTHETNLTDQLRKIIVSVNGVEELNII